LRIGLNLLHALPEIGGGWNYMSSLIAAVGREDRANEYVAFVTEESAVLVPQAPNFQSRMIRLRSKTRALRVLFENTALQALIWREGVDCVHWFANVHGVLNAAPAVVTIYDLQPFLGYVELSTIKRNYLRWRLRAAARDAAMLLPMSQATAADLHQRLGADPQRMTVIPPVLEPVFTPPAQHDIDRCRQRYRLPEHFWLYVAHMYAHKNHTRLLEAYQALKREMPDAWPLVLRGDPQPGGPDVAALVARLGLAADVILLPRLSRGELSTLYGAATALVFPSMYEGAGLPVLEAQACGCPVVASNIPAVREFAGEAAEYFSPLDVSDIRRAMMALITDRSARARLRSLGVERAQAVRAQPVVRHLLGAYEQAVSNGRGRAREPRSARQL
jgi:glycosyltransferase involved in cell wall biosynthesis